MKDADAGLDIAEQLRVLVEDDYALVASRAGEKVLGEVRAELGLTN